MGLIFGQILLDLAFYKQRLTLIPFSKIKGRRITSQSHTPVVIELHMQFQRWRDICAV